MRLRIPITGTVEQVDPCIIGKDDDPIRLINIDLGNVSWELVHLNLDAEEMEIEVTPSEDIAVDTGEIDIEGEPIWKNRKATDEERLQFIENARSLSLERMSKEALYTLSKSPRLRNPFKERV